MNCSQCQAPLAPDAKFCSNCATPVADPGVRAKPKAILPQSLAIVGIVFILIWFYTSTINVHKERETGLIRWAATRGAAQKMMMTGPGGSSQQWERTFNGYTVSINREGDNKAEVFFYNGGKLMDQEIVVKDETDSWHPVTSWGDSTP